MDALESHKLRKESGIARNVPPRWNAEEDDNMITAAQNMQF